MLCLLGSDEIIKLNVVFSVLHILSAGNIKWVVLRELTLACFPKYDKVVDAMRRTEELAGILHQALCLHF
jgi:hypothetical protein